MRKLILFFLLTTLSFAGTIRVAVAANVSYAIKDLIKDFNKDYPNCKVEVNLGSSGQLAAQILHGAPYDIFMAANMGYPNALYSKGKSVDKPKVYAYGELALLTTKDINISQGLKVLTSSKVKKIAVANPKTAPYGVATKEALVNAKLYDKIKSKFIYGQSIGQTLIYTLKAADIGFVAKSSLFSKELSYLKKGVNWVELNAKYTPTKQGVVLLNRSKDNKEAVAFYNYILSSMAKEIFKKYGYKVDE